MKTNEYLNEFLNLRCAGDVLNVVNPLGSSAAKEITESMAIIKRLRPLVLKEPMKYTVIDLCAGNALTSVLSAFLLPIKKAIAVDKRARKRPWDEADRFQYVQDDIRDRWFPIRDNTRIDENTIIISVHPCGKLANMVVELFQLTNAKAIILMPCCVGAAKHSGLEFIPPIIRQRINQYEQWECYLWGRVAAVLGRDNVKMVRDHKCLSPRNTIIIGERK